MPRRAAVFITAVLLLAMAAPVSAQTPTDASSLVYIVQEGDSLWTIAARFNVSVADLQAANNLTTADIYVGDQLIIPGLEGLSGTLITVPVPFGESLRSLSRQYRFDLPTLRKLNHLVSPAQVYAGYQLIMLQQENRAPWSSRAQLGAGDTLLEMAVRQGSDPWTIAQINGLSGPEAAMPGDLLYLPSGDSTVAPSGLPPGIVSAEVDPLPLTQGDTAQIKVTTSQPATLGGQLAGFPLHFFSVEGNTQAAWQGVYGMADPGLYPLRIDITLPDGSTQSFEQMVRVDAGNFKAETLSVESSTIDPAVTEPEQEWLESTVSAVTPDRHWLGLFQLPVADDLSCIRSYFGNRRSYNNGQLYSFHTGLDFGPCSETHPLDIYAPADGVVVFTGLKIVRGNVTIIDHGQGVYSGLFHQAEIYVNPGDPVTAGQLIGKMGATGRVTGAHLHWDLWVNGVQVDPLTWLNVAFPH
jgi:murein DD-endopeptidase MepM/ murein hydrolase activator NlpD